MEIKFSFNLDIHSFLTVPASEQKKNTIENKFYRR